MRRTLVPILDGIDAQELATKVSYVGSGERKSYPSFAGAPKLRADASKCDPRFTDASEITNWLRDAFVAGQVGAPWEGGFPRYVWRRVDGVCYEARLVNRDAGEYKGYPLEEGECPPGL